MSRHPQQASRAVADRDRGHARLRTVTATAGMLGVVTAGAVAFALPGAQHNSSGSPGTGSSAQSSSGKSSSGSSITPASTAPSAGSGSGSVTSGGS